MTVNLEVEVSSGEVRAVTVPATAADVTVLNGPVQLCGWSLREPTGLASAVAEIQDGNRVLGEVDMPAGSTKTEWLGRDGLHVHGQITVHLVAGSITGCIYARYEDSTT